MSFERGREATQVSRSRPTWQPCSPAAHVHAPPDSCLCLPAGPRTIHAPARLTLCMMTTAHCAHVSCSLRSKVEEDALGYRRTDRQAFATLPRPRNQRCHSACRDGASGDADGSTASAFAGAQRRCCEPLWAGSIGTVPVVDAETRARVRGDVCVFRSVAPRTRARRRVNRTTAGLQQVRSTSQC